MNYLKVATAAIATVALAGAGYLAIETTVVDCGRLTVTNEEATQGEPPEYREYTYGSHEYEEYEIVAYWPSGQRRTVTFTMDMLSETDQNKLQEPGKHELTIYYKGASAPLKLEVVRYFQVAFVTNGGPDIDPLEAVRNGSTITLPVIEREGFVFLGWYLDPEFSGLPFSEETSIETDLILYARWEELLS